MAVRRTHKTTPSGMVVTKVERKSTKSGLQSLIPRIRREQHEALKALAKRTRVTYSELWRMALEDVLRKHGEKA